MGIARRFCFSLMLTSLVISCFAGRGPPGINENRLITEDYEDPKANPRHDPSIPPPPPMPATTTATAIHNGSDIYDILPAN
ncbi:hypothetical protein PanWU01x14_094300 [Parasponia andersonii]|uniref:Transmembrane protein n=1 Tax=Parasponia andersonii TaxID=3476 RepID=A0A2P5D5P6_PARAD|nr:hypothetical protein PanWU01x14_094300 [Parasponia andersonii]